MIWNGMPGNSGMRLELFPKFVKIVSMMHIFPRLIFSLVLLCGLWNQGQAQAAPCKPSKKAPAKIVKKPSVKTSVKTAARTVPQRPAVRSKSYAVPFSGEKSHTQIDAIVDEYDPTLNIGVLVRDLDTGQELASRNANRHFTPSSVAKVFTAAAAVKKLGPDFTFDTTLYVNNSGHSAIRFAGDPSLKVGDVVGLLAPLRGKTLSGNFYLDESALDYTGTHGGWLVEDTKRCYGAPVGGLMVDKNCTAVQVKGGYARVPVEDADERIEEVLLNAFAKNGIQFRGKFVHDRPNYDHFQPVNTHHSAPLRNLLTKAIKKSDNTISDAVFLQIGRGEQVGEGMWGRAQRAVKRVLSQEGVDLSRCALLDGSGLTRHNLVTPRQMSEMLHAIYRSPQLRAEFNHYFPISGVDGTLKYRLVQEGMVGKVQAKTGTMRGSSGLAGFIQTQSGRRLSFVIFMNNIYGPVRPYLAIQNRILHYLHGA